MKCAEGLKNFFKKLNPDEKSLNSIPRYTCGTERKKSRILQVQVFYCYNALGCSNVSIGDFLGKKKQFKVKSMASGGYERIFIYVLTSF